MSERQTLALELIERQGQVYIMFGYDDDEELLLEVEENTKERG